MIGALMGDADQQDAEVHYLARPVHEVINEVHDDPDGDDEPVLRLPHLAPEFWDACPEFARVRDYAHHRAGFPESLLITTYARVAALVRRGTVVDTGMLTPVPLNFFAGLVGVSGRGKSASIGLARAFLPYGERPRRRCQRCRPTRTPATRRPRCRSRAGRAPPF